MTPLLVPPQYCTSSCIKVVELNGSNGFVLNLEKTITSCRLEEKVDGRLGFLGAATASNGPLSKVKHLVSWPLVEGVVCGHQWLCSLPGQLEALPAEILWDVQLAKPGSASKFMAVPLETC